ncbi:MAG: IPT/TIG domain-containing protein [Candidatus Pacebacteria bacterium]|nr:IPT/TIG domain-containing protein [Candidatus Paceibacterota bacterium]
MKKKYRFLFLATALFFVTQFTVADAVGVPSITSMSSSAGQVGTKLVLDGKNFSKKGARIEFGGGYVMSSIKSVGNKISFVVPGYTQIKCLEQTITTALPCEQLMKQVNPGVYSVVVVNADGARSAASYFVVEPTETKDMKIVRMSRSSGVKDSLVTIGVSGNNLVSSQGVLQADVLFGSPYFALTGQERVWSGKNILYMQFRVPSTLVKQCEQASCSSHDVAIGNRYPVYVVNQVTGQRSAPAYFKVTSK